MAPAEVHRQPAAPLGEVREDQDLLVGLEHRRDDLLQPGQLARPSGERTAIVLIGGGVVADLLERGDRGEDGALAAFGLRVLRRGHELVDHRLVQPDLLGGHEAVVELVDLVRQLGRHLGLGLGAAEHEDPVERPQRGLALAGHLGNERGSWSGQPGVGEVEDRPEVAEAVLDRGAGEGQAVAARRAGAASERCRWSWFLIACASSSTTVRQRRCSSNSMSRTAVP